jgi:YidC/Oxa1 family membrane protein insertase
MLWDNWNRFSGRPSMFFPGVTQQQAAPAATGTAPAPTQAAAANGAAPAAMPNGATAAPVHGETVTVTTDVFKADFNTAGGDLVRLELLKQKDSIDPSKNVVLFDDSPHRTYLEQSGLIGDLPNHLSLYTARPGARTLDGRDQVQLVLEAEKGGVKLIKTYTFKRDDYVIDVRHDVVNNSGAPISPTLYMKLVRDDRKPEGETKFYSAFTGPVVYTESDHYQKCDREKVDKCEHPAKADNGWIALVQHYFVSALIPPQKVQRDIITDWAQTGCTTIGARCYFVGVTLPVGTVAPGATAGMDSRLYSGPEDSAILEKVAPGMESVKDYGKLKIVAEPIFLLMQAIHKVLGNWGWTIVALTIVIKLLFFPLATASYRSMAKMKTVTPKMTAIRERYKDDSAKMNQAMMELYKTEKINPFGGCLPVVVQIPVFMALYWVLLASVEMRNASWFWIHDLASPDKLFTIPGIDMPIGILPIVMAVSMFVQTKLNPTPPDPMQAKMMMFMPIVFSVMFFFFPAGLVLYWVVNNLFSIAQQWVITKKLSGQKS